MKKVIILGSVSFVLDNAKVGINWIAEYLSNNGYQVIYVSSASTVLDVLFKTKRRRFIAAWIKGGRFKINKNLTEIVFKSPWLLNRLNNKYKHVTAGIFENKLLNEKYDVLISTVGALSLFVDRVSAKQKILRLQDSPHDFGISGYDIKYFEKLLQQQRFNQIWSVSMKLYEYAERFKPKRNLYLPNGVDLTLFKNQTQQIKYNKAIYFGVFSAWVDIGLILDAAKELPDWTFDLFGVGFKHLDKLPNNVTYHGAIKNEQIPEKLLNYEVGLIPFKNCPHIDVVERPLKFYQYLASGVGIASVSHGGLKLGMGDWACYGNTSQEFASAILMASDKRRLWSKIEISNYLKKYDWQEILINMKNLINK